MDDFATGFIAGQSDNNNGNCNNGWGADGGWLWILVIFALLGFGGNGWGNWGGNNGGGALTRADLCQDMNFGQLENGVRGISQGICDSTFALNNTIVNGFNGVGNAVCNLGYEQAQLHNATQVAIMQGNNALQAQLAQCCCDNRTGQMNIINSMERGFCQANYNDATNTTAIIQNAHNDTDRVLAKLDAMEMARKDETIFALREKLSAADLAASQAAQNNYLVNALRPCPIPAYISCNPWAAQAPYGSCGNCGNGCGCGC